jgi:putative transposase
MRPGASIPKNKVELQAKGTCSATRRLRKQSGRERRFVACENHKISKAIVNTDFAVFALEDLSKIYKDRKMPKGMRSKLSTWAFFQLESFIKYKAEELGKRVVNIDPTLTSQTCSRCGWIDKASRKGNDYQCIRCGFHLHADLNASRNIARLGISEVGRLPANQPHATGEEGDLSGVHRRS